MLRSIGVAFGSKMICWILVLLCASLVLQLVGFVTPGWFVFKLAVWKVDIGLWYTIACDTECNTYTITGFLDIIKPGLGVFFEQTLLEHRVESSIALATSLVSAVSLAYTRRYRNNKWYPWILVGVSLSSVISGVLSLVAAGKMGDHVRTEHYLHMRLLKRSPYLIPYSVLLTGIGGIVACLASILLVFKAHQLHRQECKKTNEPVAYSANTDHAVCFCSTEPTVEPGSNTTTEEHNEINERGGSCINSQELTMDQYISPSPESEGEKSEPSTVWSGLPKYTRFN